MGYSMSLKNESFKIKAENVGKAIQAIKALDTKTGRNTGMGRDSYSWVSNGFSKKGTLYDIMYEWRWAPEMNYDELNNETDAFGMCFEGGNIGDEGTLFEAIAPFVEPGSFIEMIGEDGSVWRWFFDGETCEEQSADIGYSDGHQEQVDYQEKHKALIAELKMWAVYTLRGKDTTIERKEVADILNNLVKKHE